MEVAEIYLLANKRSHLVWEAERREAINNDDHGLMFYLLVISIYE
jgi:hypothetical protein